MKNVIKQKTIGVNPLEEYLSTPKNPIEAETIEPELQSSVKKQRVTIHIPVDLIDRVKNAVYWEPGLTLAGFAEDALSKALEQMETERGAPFPGRKEHKLKGGRPIK